MDTALLTAEEHSIMRRGNRILSKHRNRILSIATAILAVLTILALPYPPLNRIIPTTEQINGFTFPPYIKGNIHESARGGISAGNPITLTVTVYLNLSALGNPPDIVWFEPQGSSIYPITTDAYGVPLSGAYPLNPENASKWTGHFDVIYNQMGNYTIRFRLQQVSKSVPNVILIRPFEVPNVVHVASEDVTVTTQTNDFFFRYLLPFWHLSASNCGSKRMEKTARQAEKTRTKSREFE